MSISFEQDGGRDIYIQGMHDRNRALNSDVVCVKLKKEDEWKVNYNLNVSHFLSIVLLIDVRGWNVSESW